MEIVHQQEELKTHHSHMTLYRSDSEQLLSLALKRSP